MARPRNTESDAAILADASAALRAGGYDALVVDELARRVGVAKTTVYRRWPTKNHLVASVVDSWLTEAPHGGGLIALVTDLAELLDPDPMRRTVAELMAAAVREPELRALVERLWQPWRDAMRELLADDAVAADQLLGAVFYRALVTHEPLDATFASALVASVAGRDR